VKKLERGVRIQIRCYSFSISIILLTTAGSTCFLFVMMGLICNE
jgi:hypothetical protein